MNIEKERRAIELLKAFEPNDGYYLCYSGGKDSDVIRILAKLAGVKHEAHHNLTTVDAPETVYYVRSFPDVIIDKALDEDGEQITMWNLIPQKGMPPTRIARYCCEVLKEHGGEGRLKITGVRWAESVNRSKNRGLIDISKHRDVMREAEGIDYSDSKYALILNNDNTDTRRLVERCYQKSQTCINPIIDWSEDEVWDFLHHYGCKSNPLYQCEKKRIGCIGCPMASGKRQKEDFKRYPVYRANYVRAFDKMLEVKKSRGVDLRGQWQSGEAVMRWWVGDDPNQITLADYFADFIEQ